MPVPLPLLRPDELLSGWTPRRIGRRILTLPEAISTNTVALDHAGAADVDGLAVFAEYQTGGRGRQGHSWVSPRGASVLCSVLLCEEGGPATAGRMVLASAVAVCEAIRNATDLQPAIKWPNDIRIRGRKVGGILVESRPGQGESRWWVVGIGVNCLQHAGHFAPELRERATSLEVESPAPVDRVAVARELLKSLDRWLGAEGDAAEVHAAWQSYAEPLGRELRLRSGGREYVGTSVSVDPLGGLILQCEGVRVWCDPLLTQSV
jgi:BirA family biotin operon repressor/biotin-[acetyl-CoA-carboxylase] ligase